MINATQARLLANTIIKNNDNTLDYLLNNIKSVANAGLHEYIVVLRGFTCELQKRLIDLGFKVDIQWSVALVIISW